MCLPNESTGLQQIGECQQVHVELGNPLKIKWVDRSQNEIVASKSKAEEYGEKGKVNNVINQMKTRGVHTVVIINKTRVISVIQNCHV